MLYGVGFSPRARGLRGVAPTVVSGVNYGYLDTIGGGQPVIVTVSSSLGITGIKFKGVAGTSVTIIDATHVSAIPAAATAGVGDVIVTNAVGDSAPGNNLVEYFDPTSICDLYADSTQRNGGSWPMRKGTGTLGGGAGQPTGSLNGRTTLAFNGTTGAWYWTTSGALSSFATAAEDWSAVLFNPTAISSNANEGYSNVALWGSGISAGVMLRSSPAMQAYAFDTASRASEAAITLGSWQLAQRKHTGGKIYAAVNGGTWPAGVTCGNFAITNGITIGRQNTSLCFDGQLAVVAIGKTAPSDADRVKFRGVLSQQWGVAL